MVTPVAGGLAAWADDRAKEFEVIAQMRDSDAPAADRALEIVRQFIVEKGLILYGGQAIDFALRLKGSGIYPEHQTPDYDFFSPQSVDHAYELADRLVAAGFPNVGAIPAIHVQTMRVATDFIYVADISYTPPEVFESLPTVSYAGMKVLHPDYQRTDMHLAFCFPFSNPPREDIFHRYRKDLKRFRLFQEFYPVGADSELNAPVAGGEEARPAPSEVAVDLSRVALHGFAAYAATRRALAELEEAAREAGAAEALAAARALAENCPLLAIGLEAQTETPNRVLVRFTPPAAAPRLALATPWPGEVVESLGGTAEWFAPYMDSRPLMARVSAPGTPSVDVFSTRNRLLAVTRIEIDGVRVAVASPQYVLLNFLYEAQVAPTPALRALYVEYYAATLNLLEAGGTLVAALRAEGGGPGVPDDIFRRFVESSPFGLPVQTIGDTNHDASYLIRIAQSAIRVGDSPPGIDPADLPDLANVPTRYYPGGKHTPGEHPAFDYGSNAAFQRAGQPLPGPVKSEEETTLPITAGRESASDKMSDKMSDKRSDKVSGSPTYLALLTNLDPAPLNELLRPAGWVPLGLREAQRRRVSLVFTEGRWNHDRRLWNVKSVMKGRLVVPEVTNKVRLHIALAEHAPELVPETFVVRLEDPGPPRMPKPGPWIWRPELGFKGQGVVAFDSQQELDRVWAEHRRTAPKSRALITRYLDDPILIDIHGEARKFHVRFYFLLVVVPPDAAGETFGPPGRRAGILTEGEIANAAAPYQRGDYENTKIHDTHFGQSAGRRFPRDFPGDAEDVFDQARRMLTAVAEMALPGACPYSEAQAGFELLGADTMVDRDGRLWLLEINDRISLDRSKVEDASAYREWLSALVFRGIAGFVLNRDVSADDNSAGPVVETCLELPFE